jgi:hypothetical protein
MEYGTIFWADTSDSIEVFSCKGKLQELWQGPSLEIHINLYSKKLQTLNFTISIHTALDDFFDSQFGVFHF